jgi:hypothetical protein
LRKLIGSSMMNLPSCGLTLVTWATFTAGLKVSCWEDWSEVELWLLKESLGRNLEEEVCVGTGTVVLVVLRMIHGHLFPAILQRMVGQSRTRLFPPSMVFSRPG